MVNMQGVHHNPEFWPNPLDYIPERHQEAYRPFTFIPFVDGARNCLGQHLSLLGEDRLLPFPFFPSFFYLPHTNQHLHCILLFYLSVLLLLESKCVLTILLRKYNFILQNPATAGEKHSYMVPIIPKEGHIYKVTRKESNSEGRWN